MRETQQSAANLRHWIRCFISDTILTVQVQAPSAVLPDVRLTVSGTSKCICGSPLHPAPHPFPIVLLLC